MKVGIYARTAAGGREVVVGQGRTVRSSAEACGDEVAVELVDDGYSVITLDWTGLGALRHAVHCGTVGAAWCLSADRLSEDHTALVALLYELAHHQVPVRFVEGPGLDGCDAVWWACLWATASGDRVLASRPPGRCSQQLASRGGDDAR